MQLTLQRRRLITGGLLLGMSLGALEATVVGTAMPTVIAALGGLEHYSWVFSAYLLTSTASVPIWGRLSDLHGRRRLYLVGVALFLLGSMLSGASSSMLQLIAFRALQGLGAGALIPLGMTMIGEIYTLRERARMQALFSGVWGVASIAGPLVGGWLTDAISWRWVFYLNLPFGVVAALIIGTVYPGGARREGARVDWAGALLLFAAVGCLLAGLSNVTAASWPWFAAAVTLAVLFGVVERRVDDQILPLALFSNRTVSLSNAIVFLIGMAMFGAVAFIPLFVQGVTGRTATEAGQVLTPVFLGWVGTSVVAARLLLRIGYRTTTVIGVVLVAAAFVCFARMDGSTGRLALLTAAFVLGAGMGFSMLSLLLATQHAVPRAELGLATSMNQFSRSIGAAIGVALMGAVLSFGLGPGAAVHLQAAAATGAFTFSPALGEHLASALHLVFGLGALIAALAFLPALALRPLDFDTSLPHDAGEQLLAAEMTSIDEDCEPAPARQPGESRQARSVSE